MKFTSHDGFKTFVRGMNMGVEKESVFYACPTSTIFSFFLERNIYTQLHGQATYNERINSPRAVTVSMVDSEQRQSVSLCDHFFHTLFLLVKPLTIQSG